MIVFAELISLWIGISERVNAGKSYGILKYFCISNNAGQLAIKDISARNGIWEDAFEAVEIGFDVDDMNLF